MNNRPCFDVSDDDTRIIDAIAVRGAPLYVRIGDDRPMMNVMMDVTACHARDCPLNLAALLAASDEDFAHDVLGIRRHMDRTTGTLDSIFEPRHARRGGPA